MGGKVVQTNPQQASGAYAGATEEAKALDAQAAKNLQWQQSAMTNMFGEKGADGKLSGGSLTPLTDPSKLSTTGPNGVYKNLYRQQTGTISQNAQAARESSRANMANRGFATGSGMENSANTQLALGEAQAKGQAYSDAWNGQHQEDLGNFWNANNLMSGNAATMGAQGTAQMQSAAQTYNNLYGTAGQGQQVQGIGSSLISGLGTLGGSMLGGWASNPAGAFCPAEGGLILVANDGTLTRIPVELLKKGAAVLGIDGDPDELLEDPTPSLQECVMITAGGKNTTVSASHAFDRIQGGYTIAGKCLGEDLVVSDGPEFSTSERVTAVQALAEKRMCYHLQLKRSHGYNVDGFWSLE